MYLLVGVILIIISIIYIVFMIKSDFRHDDFFRKIKLIIGVTGLFIGGIMAIVKYFE